MEKKLRLISSAWRIYRSQGTRALIKQSTQRLTRKAIEKKKYADWIDRYEPSLAELLKYKRQIVRWKNAPLLSIIMPTFNTPEAWLIKAIESVQNQVYLNWELCIADDASTDTATRATLERFVASDPRIRVTFRQSNGHISQASNTAISMVRGEYIVLLDHDDELHPLALAYVAQMIRKNPEVAIIYSDEDKLDEQGQRTSPYFKSAFNYELFLSHNMVSHLGVYRKSLVDEVGGFRDDFVGSQDYDLALRCLEKIAPSQVLHIPRVLYHWRIHAAGTALSGDAKPYALNAAIRTVTEHLERTGSPAVVEESPEAMGMHRIRFRNNEPAPKVDLVLYGVLSEAEWMRMTRNICHQTSYANYQLTLIVRNVTDRLLLCFDPDHFGRCMQWAEGENLHTALNKAAHHCDAEYLCFANASLQPLNEVWLNEMMMQGRRPGIGVVGARLWSVDDVLEDAGQIIGMNGHSGSAHRGLRRHHPGYLGRAVLLQEFSAVSSACMLVKRDVFLKAGGFNASDYRSDLGGIDFCLQLREAGLRNIWTPHAELKYGPSQERDELRSVFGERGQREMDYFKKRWASYFANDPAYSPNLTLEATDFSLAWPPRVRLHDFD